MPTNKVRLEICGCSYVISTTDTEQYTLSLAEKLDHSMNEIMAQNPAASVTAAAVLSALEYLLSLIHISAPCHGWTAYSLPDPSPALGSVRRSRAGSQPMPPHSHTAENG